MTNLRAGGGEEFIFVFYGTQSENAKAIAEKLRKCVERSKSIIGKFNINVTMSFGVAQFNIENPTSTYCIKKADEAMYRAKDQGRNCVIVSG